MFQRKKWGAYALTAVAAGCLTFDAQSQTLVGGAGSGVNSTQAFDPSSAPLSPRAFALGNDPFAGVGFNQCVTQATLLASRSTLPDALTITSENALSSGLASLGGILGGGIGAAATGGNFGQGAFAGSQGLGCDGPLPDISTFGSTNSCDAFKVNGAFSEVQISAKMAEIQMAGSKASCKAAQAAKAEGILDCYSEEFQNLKDAMQEVKKDFDANLTAMKQYETTVQAEIEREERKVETLTAKRGTLDAAKREMEGIIANIIRKPTGDAKAPDRTSLQGLILVINQQKDIQKNFDLTKKRARATRTGACLNGSGATNSGIRNCPNAGGELLPPKECILTIFRDSVAVQLSGGTSRVSPADKKKADFAQKTFRARLDQMLNDFNGSNPKVQDAESFERRYGSELRQFGVAGDQLIQEIKNCGEEVDADIEQELLDPASALGSESIGLRETATQLSSEMGAIINQLDTAVRNAGKEVFGQELNEAVNGLGCNTTSTASNDGQTAFQNVALQQQIKCAQGLAGTIEAMLNGTPPPNASAPLEVPLNVPGLDGAPERCKGLRDCLDKTEKLISASQTRQSDLKGTGTFKDSRCPQGCPGLKKFRKDSNEAIRTAAQQTADLFKRRVAIAKAQFAQIKGLLNGLNVSFPSKKPANVSLNEFCQESDEKLCELPGDFSDKIAGMAGLPELNPEDFEAPKAKASEEKTKAVNFAGQLRAKVSELSTLAASCKKAQKSEALAKNTSRLRRQIQDALAQCQVGAGLAGNTASQDFGARVPELSRNLTRICEDAPGDNEDCNGALSSELTRAQGTCSQVVQDRSQQRTRDRRQACVDEAGPATTTAQDGTLRRNSAFDDCMARPAGDGQTGI